MYQPLTVDLPRTTPKEGATLCGTYTSPNTRVGIPIYPVYRSKINFRNPGTFAPSRWLGDEELLATNTRCSSHYR